MSTVVTSELHQPPVFAKFMDQDILSEMGRLLFCGLNIFALNGYHIKLFDNIDFEGLEKDRPYIRLVESIENVVLVDVIPEKTQDMIYLFDREDKECAHRQWKKRIQIKFNIFSSYFWSSFSNFRPVIMPYPMHPLLYGTDLDSRLAAGRQQQRSMRIFFSGDTEGYRKNRINYPARKLTRSEIIDTIMAEIGDKTISITDAESYNRLLEDGYIQKPVMVNNKQFRIESRYWLEALSQSDFFLCPPGYVMPMCHNVIEAMSVGTIPVINYPEWLNPSLTDMVNCVAFNDKVDLIAKITRILDLEQEKISEMKANVIDYYMRNLDPKSFVNELEMDADQNIIMLMITDAYVANNASKLNKNSILIKGTPHQPADIWLAIRRSFTGG